MRQPTSHARTRRATVQLAALAFMALASTGTAQQACSPSNPEGLVVATDTRAGDEFGYSVAVSGHTAVVGAWVDETAAGETGTATVFVRQGGVWSEQAYLLPVDAAEGDQFGHSVAIDGDTVLIGSKLDDDAGLNSGSAHVFVRQGPLWTHQAKLTASDAAAGDFFGHAVTLRGDVAVVSSHRDDDAGSSSGSVHVFRRSGTTWVEEQKLRPHHDVAGAEFGYSVALAAPDVLAVGSRNASQAAAGAGAAHVFVRSRGRWIEQAELLASDAAADDEFGWSIGADGAVVVVGAHQADGVAPDSGAAYVFERVGPGWVEQARLEPADVLADARVGSAVAVHGTRVMVGGPFHAHASPGAPSAAWYFTKQAGVWQEEGEVLPFSGQGGSWFGWSLALDRNVAIVGARFDDTAGLRAGAAELFACGELECANGLDDDGDGDQDCADSDCFGIGTCSVEICTNLLDDDGDGDVDCVDLDCAGAPPCVPEDCANGVDDDGDGDLDCEDQDCMGMAPCGVEDCWNGLDDDFDSLSDCADPDCASGPPCAEDCANGIDDDWDGDVDCADSDCVCDTDMDGTIDDDDCAPTDPGAFAMPTEIPQLLVDKLGLPAGTTRLTWTDVRPMAGDDTTFEVALDPLGVLHVRRVADAPCRATTVEPRHDDILPLVGDGRYYLVRGVNVCGPLTGEAWGQDSSGAPRPACP